MFSTEFNKEEVEEAPAVEVVRTKNIELKPMDVEEAILQMELLGHDSLSILIAKIIQLMYYISVKMVTMA